MAISVAVGVSEELDPVEAFGIAAARAARGLEGDCDLALVFAGAPHLGHAKWILSEVHERLAPRSLIGCGRSSAGRSFKPRSIAVNLPARPRVSTRTSSISVSELQ